MNNIFSIPKNDWDLALLKMQDNFSIYGPIGENSHIDYEEINDSNLRNITYNHPKPTTPLKTFFLPISENVSEYQSKGNRIILGVPNCDYHGLSLLDELYLDEDFTDAPYKDLRDNTIIVVFDCFAILDHCHCIIYGIQPFSDKNCDASATLFQDNIILKVGNEKGQKFYEELKKYCTIAKANEATLKDIETEKKKIIKKLENNNKGLPGYAETGALIKRSDDNVWKKYSKTCVSCGACATSCPTCSCFLLIDKPGFEKVRHLDACQYPGFERVAGDEDPLKNLFKRFRNRYLCKYVWKPEKFNSIACTGCGRCIEACIGKINKNELFRELSN